MYLLRYEYLPNYSKYYVSRVTIRNILKNIDLNTTGKLFPKKKLQETSVNFLIAESVIYVLFCTLRLNVVFERDGGAARSWFIVFVILRSAQQSSDYIIEMALYIKLGIAESK